MRSLEQFVLYNDLNTEWGYCKVSIIDKGLDRFDIVYAAFDENLSVNIIKRYSYPAYFL